MPDCIPLSRCLIDSSSVMTRSDGLDGCCWSACDWSVSLRVGGNCNRGATRPGPGIQGQFKAVINIPTLCQDSVHALITCCFSTSVSVYPTPFRLISKANSLECDSLLARMNMTTWSCVCSEMSRPLMSTTRSPSRSLGSHRPAYKQHNTRQYFILVQSCSQHLEQQTDIAETKN